MKGFRSVAPSTQRVRVCPLGWMPKQCFECRTIKVLMLAGRSACIPVKQAKYFFFLMDQLLDVRVVFHNLSDTMAYNFLVYIYRVL